MKNNKSYIIRLFAFCLSLVVFAACEEDSDTDFIAFDGTTEGLLLDRLTNVSLFYEAAVKTGLDSRLTGSTPFTYFVPTNSAMQVALESVGAKSISGASVEDLTTIINNHTFDGSIMSTDLTKSLITSVGGGSSYVTLSGETVILNANSTVTNANNASDNGVVHIIDFPLLTFPTNSILEIVNSSAMDTENPEFTILAEALRLTGLDATVGGSTELTVIAPTDQAFIDGGIELADLASIDVNVLTDLLLSHVFDGRNFTVDLTSSRIYSALGDDSEGIRGFDFDVANDNIDIGINVEEESSTSTVNILATNGTIHVVDQVLTAEPFLIDVLDGSSDLSGGFDFLLGAYLTGINNSTEFNFDSLLTTETVYSLMVPRFFDPAVAEPMLSENIQGHIFEGSVSLDDSKGQTLEAINGRRYFVTEGADEFGWINGRTRIQTFTSGDPIIEDVEVYNGFVTNVISEFVPLPEISTSSAIANAEAMDMEQDSLRLFNLSLEFLELDSVPNATYLYVTDAAFISALNDADLDSTLAELQALNDEDLLAAFEDKVDQEALTEVVNRHIVTTVFFGVDLIEGLSYTTRNAETLEIVTVNADVSSEFGIFYNDEGTISIIPVVVADILGSNGVVHILEELIPDDI